MWMQCLVSVALLLYMYILYHAVAQHVDDAVSSLCVPLVVHVYYTKL